MKHHTDKKAAQDYLRGYDNYPYEPKPGATGDEWDGYYDAQRYSDTKLEYEAEVYEDRMRELGWRE